MNDDPLALILAGVAGVGLGAVFFGGLWWTVRKGMTSAQPAFWFFGSLLIRMGAVLTGFYFVGAGHWERLLACLLGFIAVRLVMMRLTRSPAKPASRPTGEDRHAP